MEGRTPQMPRLPVVVGALSLMVAAALSAYGFHGLAGRIPPADLASWDWANQLHFVHSLGLILIGLLMRQDPRSRLLFGASLLMMAGLVLFSGSIYAEVLGAPEAIGRVAPFGGTSFMLGWLLTGIAGWRMRA
jgi:uncharacterized membrane protein YgdD (TMEM256/DUF423 family)